MNKLILNLKSPISINRTQKLLEQVCSNIGKKWAIWYSPSKNFYYVKINGIYNPVYLNDLLRLASWLNQEAIAYQMVCDIHHAKGMVGLKAWRWEFIPSLFTKKASKKRGFVLLSTHKTNPPKIDYSIMLTT